MANDPNKKLETSLRDGLRKLSPNQAQAIRQAFDKAADAFWNAMPFQIRTALFANSVAGFGKFEPRPDASFRSGDTATIYLEPVAYGFAGGAE